MSNFRVFAWGWAMANAAQLLAHLAGIGPEIDIRSTVAGVVMAACWGFAAVAMFGDRQKA